MRALLTALLLACAVTFPAQAQTILHLGDTVEAGGPGGQAFRHLCPEGQVLSGFQPIFGKDMDAIRGYCRTLQGAETAGKSFNMGTIGGGGGNQQGTVTCTPNVIEGMWVDVSNVNLVHHIKLNCRELATHRTYERIVNDGGAGGGTPIRHDGAAQRTEYVGCGSGAFAIGYFGGYYALIDRLGLICGKLEDAPRPVKKTTRKGNKAASPVDNGDDADDGGGGAPRANTDTTIYDEPQGNDVAYLRQGDRVTIIQCGETAENWCEISAPQYGWVWGPELSR